MQKIISYPLTILHFILFFLMLVIFHPIQLICHKIWGYDAHRKSVAILNWFLMQTQLPLFNTFDFKFKEELPVGPSYIFVSNHQSMFDIPPLIYHLRHYHAKFIAKKELAKGIPSISLNLRIGENCAIDRKDARQSIAALIKFAKNVYEKKRSVVIFAEGSRSRTGVPKPFKTKGLLTLFKYIPDAVVVPVTVNNSWKVDRYGKFPYGIGNKISVLVHEPIPIAGRDGEEVIAQAESVVHGAVTSTAIDS
ncbi:MAG: lysophospholipid acyltransferase family protein [Nonlabens ulvanivorans]|uniref:Glycerol acyltransferase n=3 Tax=Nonlabens ulvanivorans TaxID=906888 RepID=A0A084JTN9_NONUL|nr:lysophospholipid acyltransferase family protein [Nonlabens ulvanivorans]KEZ92323.1 glycerol acyltransferase [Nonlabens ulvanivorans]WOI22492.1 lysophospholipid acyltransferase family protein [Nonlabens ulvanivorans]